MERAAHYVLLLLVEKMFDDYEVDFDLVNYTFQFKHKINEKVLHVFHAFDMKILLTVP